MLKNKNLYFNFVVLTLVLTISIVFTLPQGVSAKENVNLSAGTMLFAKTLDTLNPRNLNVGDEVALVIAEDVVVNGNVVIKAGAPVFATVSRAESNGMLGKAGEISIRLDSVKAVDGTNILLSGTKMVVGEDKSSTSLIIGLILCFPFLLMKGENAVIPANTMIKARVAGTYNINI